MHRCMVFIMSQPLTRYSRWDQHAQIAKPGDVMHLLTHAKVGLGPVIRAARGGGVRLTEIRHKLQHKVTEIQKNNLCVRTEAGSALLLLCVVCAMDPHRQLQIYLINIHIDRSDPGSEDHHMCPPQWENYGSRFVA